MAATIVQSAVPDGTTWPDSADAVITFPLGLVGCESWKRFVLLVDDEEDLPVATLQSLDDPAVAFLVADPTMIEPGYEVTLRSEDRAALGLVDGGEPVLYCTLSVGEGGWILANLLGPLVVNPLTRTGKQVVLADSPYSARHPISPLGT